MEKIKIDIYRLVSGDPGTGHFILVMEELEGTRRLPIVIGTPEAQAIALALEGIHPPRPLTHDLMHNICNHFEISLKEILITDLREGTFYGRLVMVQNDIEHEIDCRPSDGIALAVRFKVPIYIDNKIIVEVGTDSEDGDELDEAPELSSRPQTVIHTESPRHNISEQIEELDKRLLEALHNEDYELAAQLRDRINRMK